MAPARPASLKVRALQWLAQREHSRSELQDNKAAQPADQVRNFVLSSEPPGANPAALTELSR